ncbi:MAG: hypothetical protein IPN29_18110 [Saprospiraceae bacterium]|nr:hypothetical protein [Saprospiraceae bacterium]
MNDKEDIHEDRETMLVIRDNLGLESTEDLTSEEMIALIARRVNELLETDKDLLLSYLYRLDISMKKINEMLRLKNLIPPHESIARLIFHRQLDRIKTKKRIKVPRIEDGWEF